MYFRRAIHPVTSEYSVADLLTSISIPIFGIYRTRLQSQSSILWMKSIVWTHVWNMKIILRLTPLSDHA